VANIWFGYAAGLVKAARLEASYPDGTELKIVVHHRGCPDPVNFTASVLSELDQVVAKVLVGESVYSFHFCLFSFIRYLRLCTNRYKIQMSYLVQQNLENLNFLCYLVQYVLYLIYI
jgi:hypothetical protein